MSRYVRWEGAGPLAGVWLDVERAVKIKDEAGNIIEPDDELEETGSCGADLCANMITRYMHGGPRLGLCERSGRRLVHGHCQKNSQRRKIQ